MGAGERVPTSLAFRLATDCPVIISRAAWGARETYCSKMDLPAKYVVIIHTAGAPCNTSADCRLRVRDTQGYHMDRMDFCDIGYQ